VDIFGDLASRRRFADLLIYVVFHRQCPTMQLGLAYSIL
jgi:hypothetical protein